jgi:hypothetical protein
MTLVSITIGAAKDMHYSRADPPHTKKNILRNKSRGGDQVGTRWGTSSINSEIVGENWGRNPHLEPSLGLPGFASGGAV